MGGVHTLNKLLGEIVALFTLQEKENKEEEKSINEQMEEVLMQIEGAKSRFNCQCDEKLLEATIFELQALETKYNYLVSVAKNEKTPA